VDLEIVTGGSSLIPTPGVGSVPGIDRVEMEKPLVDEERAIAFDQQHGSRRVLHCKLGVSYY